MTSGGDAIARPDGRSNMPNEGDAFLASFYSLSFTNWMHSYCLSFLDGSTQQDDNHIVGDGPGRISHPDGHNHMTTEGESLLIYLP